MISVTVWPSRGMTSAGRAGRPPYGWPWSSWHHRRGERAKGVVTHGHVPPRCGAAGDPRLGSSVEAAGHRRGSRGPVTACAPACPVPLDTLLSQPRVVEFSSIPTQSRSSASATTPTVPAPKKGSSTTPGSQGAGQAQPGRGRRDAATTHRDGYRRTSAPGAAWFTSADQSS